MQLAGTRRVLELAHKLIGATWGDEGTTRIRHAWTADPDLIRQLGTGQACYIHRGTPTYVQIARPRPSPLTLPAARTLSRPVIIPPARSPANGHREHPTVPLPVTGLDDVLGPGESPVNPFTALGLPARPDLTDDQVRRAWRAIAARTHPDWSDGGNPAAYAAAAAAYAQLRTGWGRTEAFADLAAAPVPPPEPSLPAPAVALLLAVAVLPARIRHGRPARLAARALIAAAIALTTVTVIPGTPSAPGVVAGCALWLVLTARGDLAPPPGR